LLLEIQEYGLAAFGNSFLTALAAPGKCADIRMLFHKNRFQVYFLKYIQKPYVLFSEDLFDKSRMESDIWLECRLKGTIM
jgi:hypothetical protein